MDILCSTCPQLSRGFGTRCPAGWSLSFVLFFYSTHFQDSVITYITREYKPVLIEGSQNQWLSDLSKSYNVKNK